MMNCNSVLAAWSWWVHCRHSIFVWEPDGSEGRPLHICYSGKDVVWPTYMQTPPPPQKGVGAKRWVLSKTVWSYWRTSKRPDRNDTINYWAPMCLINKHRAVLGKQKEKPDRKPHCLVDETPPSLEKQRWVAQAQPPFRDFHVNMDKQ